MAVIMTYFAKSLVRGKVGRALVAIRDNDIAAEIMGINVGSYKILAFGIGCFFAGISGSLWAHYCGYVNTEFFLISESIWFLGFLVLGGVGSILGAILGVIAWQLLDQAVVRIAPFLESLAITGGTGEIWASLSIILYAIVIIIFLVFEPRGLAHRWEIFKAFYRLHPFAYA
jgi:branched-chain amino acid transport system permease protein